MANNNNNDDVFPPFPRRDPRKTLAPHKKLWYFPDIGENPYTTMDEELIITRNLDNFLNHRPVDNDASKPKDHCCFGFKDACVKKICTCGALFAQRLRNERAGGASNQAIVDKWVPRLTPFARLMKKIDRHAPRSTRNGVVNAAGDDIMSIEVLFHLLELGHPFSPPDKGNPVMDYIMQFGDEEDEDKEVWVCHTFLWEFGGHVDGKQGPKMFMKTFLKTEERREEILDNNFQTYFREVCLLKANLRQLVKWILANSVEEGRLRVYGDLEKEGTKNIVAFQKMTANGVKLSNDTVTIRSDKKTAMKSWWVPVKNWYMEWRSNGCLIVAAPGMDCTIRTSEDSEVYSVFLLSNTPATTDGVMHWGNAGTVSVADFRPILKALNMGSLEQETTWVRNLVGVPDQGYGRVIQRTLLNFDPDGNAIRLLADHLRVRDLDGRKLDDFMDFAAASCEDLMPESVPGQPKYHYYGWADLLVSHREEYMQVKPKEMPHLAQVPHTWDKVTLDRLSAKGIRAFSCTIPLSKDGAWLRVYPHGEGTQLQGGKHPFGAMVFIPYGTMYMQPAATVHGGGFRFSFNGNRRVQLIVFFVPDNLSEEQVREAQLGTAYTRRYFPDLARSEDPVQDGVYNLGKVQADPRTEDKEPFFKKACEVMGY